MFVDMETTKKLYDKWVNDVMAWADYIGPQVNKPLATVQAKPFFDHQSEILFLGINPAEDGCYRKEDRDYYIKRFYDGNAPENWAAGGRGGQKRWDWLFHPERPGNAFSKVGWGDAVNPGNYLFFNILFFTTLHGGTDFNFNEVKEQCATFMAEAVTQVFRPKCVICFSVNKVFYPLGGKVHFDHVSRLPVTLPDGKPCRFRVMRGENDGIVYYGIPHLSAAVGLSKVAFESIIAAVHKDFKG